MAANFDAYLDIDVETIERPSPPPIGHWLATIKSGKGKEVNYGEGKDKTPVYELTLTLNSPYEDAIQSAEENGTDANTYNNRLVTRDYTLNEEGGTFALRQVAEVACELDTKGLKLRDVLAQLPGQQVKIFIDHRAGKGDREGQFFANVKQVLKAD